MMNRSQKHCNIFYFISLSKYVINNLYFFSYKKLPLDLRQTYGMSFLYLYNLFYLNLFDQSAYIKYIFILIYIFKNTT